jgi:NAD(P)-dependent dehydrogenase (short-subunit alcohol dehydrogenase family)
MALDVDAIRLDGKVAVVTGGGAGIGRGIAVGLATFGAEVAIWERDPDTCAAAAEQVHGLGVTTDVREADQVEAALATTLDRFGRIDVLVNNAGGTFRTPFLDTSDNAFDALYRENLRQVLVCTQRVTRVMADRGEGGSVITITSIEGTRAAPGYAAYAAAKAGVISLTQTLALELAPHGIRVNALAPDLTLTEGILALAPPGSDRRWGDTVPLGRAGTVEEMAGAAVFLASSMASYITGQTIHVDGGTAAASGWYHHPDTGDYVLGTP